MDEPRVLFIPGAGVNSGGLTLRSVDRVNAALNQLAVSVNPGYHIHFTGGAPHSLMTNRLSEAASMLMHFRLQMLELSLVNSSARISVECKSWHTYDNVRLSLPVLSQAPDLRANWDAVQFDIPTHETHFERFELTFAAYGIDKNRLNRVPVGYELTEQELKTEKIFKRMHEVDPRGLFFGTLFWALVLAKKMYGSGR